MQFLILDFFMGESKDVIYGKIFLSIIIGILYMNCYINDVCFLFEKFLINKGNICIFKISKYKKKDDF